MDKDKLLKSLVKVEEDMCYLEMKGDKYGHEWKNKNSFRTKVINDLKE